MQTIQALALGVSVLLAAWRFISLGNASAGAVRKIARPFRFAPLGDRQRKRQQT